MPTNDERAQLSRLAYEDDEKPANAGDLRIWWLPQVPGKSFHRLVANLQEAALLLDSIAAYDAFQLLNRIKPDYCNAGGLQVFEDGEWSDWYDEETGDDFDQWRASQLEAA